MTRELAIEILSGDVLGTKEQTAEAICMAIEALTEQKTGKWIGNEFGECSVCGHKGCASDIWDRCVKYYCPNCGALLTDSVSEDVYPIEDAEW